MDNILRVIGIGEGDWAFKNTFEIDPRVLQLDNVDIVFEGLDTYAVIELVC
jgi:beta-mannosidase